MEIKKLKVFGNPKACRCYAVERKADGLILLDSFRITHSKIINFKKTMPNAKEWKIIRVRVAVKIETRKKIKHEKRTKI